MLSRSLLYRGLARQAPALRSAYSSATDNPIPANNPNPTSPRSPVSATNATPVSSEGSMDASLQESVEKGEERRVMQAPNREGVWSKSQQPREKAMVGPRFEQTIMLDQVRCARCSAVLGMGRESVARGILGREEGMKRNANSLDVTATPTLRHGTHPQATRALDKQEGRLLRRRRGPARPPANLHQHRQAADLLVHVLRSAIREFPPTLKSCWCSSL